MCIQWTRVLYSVVITRPPYPPISQFSRPCNEFTSVWSMFPCNKILWKDQRWYWLLTKETFYLSLQNSNTANCQPILISQRQIFYWLDHL